MSVFSKSPSASVPDLTGVHVHYGLYRCERVIGRGAWGVVYLATKVTEPGSRYAIKAISTYKRDKNVLNSIAREVAFHKHASAISDGVLRLVDSSEDPELGLLYIITDYCPDGDLLDMILARKYSGNDELIRSVFVQLLDAVEGCHSSLIFHRDLKPENILCKDGGKKVVIADFGFATDRPVTKDFNMGSEPFMSPEIRGGLHKHSVNCSSRHGDIWALGVTLMTLVAGSLPWQKASLRDKHFAAFVRDPNFLYATFPISREINYILQRVFNPDPASRISIKELKARILKIDRFTTSRSELYRHAPPPPRPKAHPKLFIPLEKVQRATQSLENTVRKFAGLNSTAPIVFPDEKRDNRATIGNDTNNTTLSSNGVVAGTPSLFVNESELAEDVPIKEVVLKNVRTIPPGETDDDSDDSDTESEGPITPETIPADQSALTVVNLEDIPELSTFSRDNNTTNVAIIDVPAKPVKAKVHDITTARPAARTKPDHPTIDLSLLTPTSRFGFGSAERNYVPQPLPLVTPPEIKAHIPLASRITPTRRGETPVRGVGVPFAYRAILFAKDRMRSKATENAKKEKAQAQYDQVRREALACLSEEEEEEERPPLRFIMMGKKVRITTAKA